METSFPFGTEPVLKVPNTESSPPSDTFNFQPIEVSVQPRPLEQAPLSAPSPNPPPLQQEIAPTMRVYTRRGPRPTNAPVLVPRDSSVVQKSPASSP